MITKTVNRRDDYLTEREEGLRHLTDKIKCILTDNLIKPLEELNGNNW